jgi:Chaperone of endosialidase
MANQNNFVVKNGLTVGSTQVIDGSTNITTTGVTINTVNVASALVYSSTTANAAYITANAAFAKANTGAGGSVVLTQLNSNKLTTATGGQTVFVTPTYTPGANQLSVFVDGVAQALTTDYTETSSTSITFGTGLAAGDLVYVQVSGYVSGNVTPAVVSSLFSNTTATAGQTVFTTPSYITGANQVSVFINGVAQLPTYDYTESSNTTITLTSGATAGDVVMTRVFNGYLANVTISTANLVGTISNSQLANSSVTVTAGTGLSGGGAAALGGSVTLTNSGVTSLTGTSNQVTASASSGAVTLSLPQSIATTSNVQFGSFGVGTVASGTTGEIRATNNITAYYSSDRKFKTDISDIPNATATVQAIGGKMFSWTQDYIDSHGGEDGYFVQKDDFGVIAQDVQAVFPQAVRTRPDGSLAVDYPKLSALAFAAIKELADRVTQLEGNK